MMTKKVLYSNKSDDYMFVYPLKSSCILKAELTFILLYIVVKYTVDQMSVFE